MSRTQHHNNYGRLTFVTALVVLSCCWLLPICRRRNTHDINKYAQYLFSCYDNNTSTSLSPHNYNLAYAPLNVYAIFAIRQNSAVSKESFSLAAE